MEQNNKNLYESTNTLTVKDKMYIHILMLILIFMYIFNDTFILKPTFRHSL